jgi:hypothetical protein
MSEDVEMPYLAQKSAHWGEQVARRWRLSAMRLPIELIGEV